MWQVIQNTPRRLPTWVGGIELSPYTSQFTNTVILNDYIAEAAYLTAIDFRQKIKLPFLVGFVLVDLGTDGYNNSGSRGATVDLNSCYYLTTSDFLTTKIATLDFYFADLNSYKDLDWINYYTNALVFKDKESTAYKVSDLKGLSINERTTIKVRLDFDLLFPFLGFTPLARKKKLLKIAGASPNSESVSYYGQIYHYDKLLHFLRNSFSANQGNVYLCP